MWHWEVIINILLQYINIKPGLQHFKLNQISFVSCTGKGGIWTHLNGRVQEIVHISHSISSASKVPCYLGFRESTQNVYILDTTIAIGLNNWNSKKTSVRLNTAFSSHGISGPWPLWVPDWEFPRINYYNGNCSHTCHGSDFVLIFRWRCPQYST